MADAHTRKIMKTKEEVLQAIHEHGLLHKADAIEPFIWPSIRLLYPETQPANYEIGASRFGGLPDLPEDWEWPHWPGYTQYDRKGNVRQHDPPGPFCFMAQINLEEVAPYDINGQLPPRGMLYFFSAVWLNCILNYQKAWQVLYYNASLSRLQSKPVPPISQEFQAALNRSNGTPENHQFKPCAMQFVTEMTLPQGYDNPNIAQMNLSEEERSHYLELSDLVSPESLQTPRYSGIPGDPPAWASEPIHRLLGHPQGGQGIGGDQWKLRLLLQLDSDLQAGTEGYPSNLFWEWDGRGFFLIPEEALQQRDFTRVELGYDVS
jgi:hypothetical protein